MFTMATLSRLLWVICAAIFLIFLFGPLVGNAMLESAGQNAEMEEWAKFRDFIKAGCGQHLITPGKPYIAERAVTVFPRFFFRYYDDSSAPENLKMTPLVKSKCGTDKCVCLTHDYDTPLDCISLPKAGCNMEMRFSYPVTEAAKTYLIGLSSVKGWVTPSSTWDQEKSVRRVAPEFPAYDEDRWFEIHAKGREISGKNLAMGFLSSFGSTNIYYITPQTIFVQLVFMEIPGTSPPTEGLLAFATEQGSGAPVSTEEALLNFNEWD